MPTIPQVPRFIPTLTEVVATPLEAPARAPAVADPSLPQVAAEYEDELTRRVMERVDAILPDRVTDALAAAVIEQTRSLLPRVREEVLAAVRSAVADAVAREVVNSGAGTHRG